MQGFPHHYPVTATASQDSLVRLDSPGVPDLVSAAPAEFDGPGDQWSPESLLVAAVADCFILTFRAIARASRLDWNGLECTTVGTLNRVERVTRFTHLDVTARLQVPEGVDMERAKLLLEKAEQGCLVTNSMTADVSLTTEVEIIGMRETA